MLNFIAVLIACVVATPALADTLDFGGRTMDCTVLQDDGRTVTVLYNVSVMRFSRSMVANITKDTEPTDPNTRASESASRLPNYTAILIRLAKQEWASDLRQIPATVISTGVMRNVPYKSHRAGGDYEINVYGDPAKPAGFEIGVRGKSLDSEQAKRNCIEFVASLLGDSEDQATVRRLKLAKDLVVRKDLTFEVTPVTAEDSYGGWWVSVYGEPGLDKVRASDKELKEITVAKSKSPAEATVATTSPKPAAVAPAAYHSDPEMQWQADDFSEARPSKSQASGGDRVFVRGYTRKDGTYVQSHTRSAPGSGGGGRRGK